LQFHSRPGLTFSQLHFKHVSKVGSTSFGDLLIDVAAPGWDPIVVKAECFDLRELAKFFDALHSVVSAVRKEGGAARGAAGAQRAVVAIDDVMGGRQGCDAELEEYGEQGKGGGGWRHEAHEKV
jgi:hypothetical protein